MKIYTQMYRLVNLFNPKLVEKSSDDIADLWIMLDNSEYEHKPMVIIKGNDIVAGKADAWEYAKLRGFNISK